MAIRIIKNDKIWMEAEAIQQVERFARFDGVINAVGLPDLHSGKVPVGTTFQTKDVVYPFLIGNDIGCGMTLFDTNIKYKKFDLDKFCKKLENTSINGEYSIGGGNHFAELQCIEKIYNKEVASQLHLDKTHLMLLVHSGSRSFGECVYRKFASTEGLVVGTERFDTYMKAHEEAVLFAKENRNGVADALMDLIGIKYHNEVLVDCNHNVVEEHDGYFYHHKGSISAYHEYAIIAGSRGEYSYVVKCLKNEETLYSLSHGAGRKWPRGLCKGRLTDKYKKDELKTTLMGGRVITNQKELLYEEASEAYKNIEEVIQILLDHNCIELVAQLKPLVTYKC